MSFNNYQSSPKTVKHRKGVDTGTDFNYMNSVPCSPQVLKRAKVSKNKYAKLMDFVDARENEWKNVIDKQQENMQMINKFYNNK